jgi:uncharacterized membrane protein
MHMPEWVIRRNCSFTPRQLALAYLALCAVSLLVAIFFAIHGAWYVLAFTVLEISAVGCAFVVFGRHVTDREHIALFDDCLLVELVKVERVTQVRLDPRHTRVDLPETPDGLVSIEADGTQIEVGRFLTEQKRRELAWELRSALASRR